VVRVGSTLSGISNMTLVWRWSLTETFCRLVTAKRAVCPLKICPCEFWTSRLVTRAYKVREELTLSLTSIKRSASQL
jgi:hypothetical protein